MSAVLPVKNADGIQTLINGLTEAVCDELEKKFQNNKFQLSTKHIFKKEEKTTSVMSVTI